MLEFLGFIVIGLPLLLLLWHIWKTDGHRPSAYKDISDRPTIPAVVLDINMPFPSMVVFMLKLALAAIPALSLLTLLYILFLGMIGIPFRGMSVFGRH